MKDFNPNQLGDFDQRLGSTIRCERIRRGLTLQDLATAIGVSPQQAHKYETGRNRLSVSRLYAIARTLGTTIEALVPDEIDCGCAAFEGKRVALEMVRNFERIASEPKRHAISQLIRALADAGGSSRE